MGEKKFVAVNTTNDIDEVLQRVLNNPQSLHPRWVPAGEGDGTGIQVS
jgi:hypothetical protein